MIRLKDKILKNKKCKRLISSICAFVILVMMIFSTFTSTANAFEFSDENESDYSFYMISSCLASALSMILADPSDQKMLDGVSKVNCNSAGCFLGYSDQAVTKGTKGLFSSMVSTAACTYDYKQLSSPAYKEIGKYSDGKTNVFSQYCMLGTGLAQLGIDQTGTDGSFNFSRQLIGTIMILTYRIAMAVNGMINIVIKTLIFLNPFQFFSKVNEINKLTDPDNPIKADFEALSQSKEEGDPSFAAKAFLEPITEVVSTLYTQLYSVSTVVLIILFAIMVYGLIMTLVDPRKASGRADIIKKYFFRAGFIILGIPLLGGTYTVLLDKLSADVESGNTAAAKIVASTFVDFESWVNNCYMVLPDVDIKVDVEEGHITASSSNDVQNICYKFNEKALKGSGTKLPGKFSVDADDKKEEALKMIGKIQTENKSKNKIEATVDEWIINMLERYKDGAKIYPSSYEQSWVAKWWMEKSDETYNSRREKYIANFSSTQKLLQRGSTAMNNFWEQEIPEGFRGPVGRPSKGIEGVDLSGKVKATKINKDLQLPALAIYNYLNSVFNETNIKVYSSEKSTSGHIRDYHYAVNLVGKGEQSFIYLVLCITMLLTYSLIGIFYSQGIVMLNIKRGIRLIIAVPGAMLGSLQSVAKIICYTVLMLAEIIINIVLFMFFTNMIFNIASIVIKAFSDAAKTVFGEPFVESVGFQSIASIMVIIFLIWFTVQAIKLRRPIVKTLEEMADNVVNKFVTGYDAKAAQAQGNGSANVTPLGAKKASMEPKSRFRNPIGRAMEKAKDTSKQEAFIGQMFGGNGSAFSEDQAFMERDMQKRAAKKHARRERMEVAKQAVVGAGEVAAGVATGNAALTAKGAGTLVKAAGNANQSQENLYQANKNADTQLATTLNPNMAKHDARLGYTKGEAKPIEKMNLGAELGQAISMGAAGSAGVAGSAGNMANGKIDLSKVLQATSRNDGTASSAMQNGLTEFANQLSYGKDYANKSENGGNVSVKRTTRRLVNDSVDEFKVSSNNTKSNSTESNSTNMVTNTVDTKVQNVAGRETITSLNTNKSNSSSSRSASTEHRRNTRTVVEETTEEIKELSNGVLNNRANANKSVYTPMNTSQNVYNTHTVNMNTHTNVQTSSSGGNTYIPQPKSQNTVQTTNSTVTHVDNVRVVNKTNVIRNNSTSPDIRPEHTSSFVTSSKTIYENTKVNHVKTESNAINTAKNDNSDSKSDK